ncbi:MAG: GNAT family N-acetyltransferase [Nocardioidaceae bacterium]|nr:GNAT family N-acetyltransferase [Nocardioidaceae bacterium]NUS52897.1 GNAT family N-acetyltransferase [Nocardioidaceae bacterium]
MIRPAVPGDVDAVHALEEQVFGAEAWSPASVREELTGDGRTAVVADEDGVVGYAVTRRAGDVVDLQRIAVAPAYRRRGLARALLAAVTEPPMMLEVSAANEPALAFYAAEGYVEVDRRRRYYRDGSDAVVMRLGESTP